MCYLLKDLVQCFLGNDSYTKPIQILAKNPEGLW